MCVARGPYGTRVQVGFRCYMGVYPERRVSMEDQINPTHMINLTEKKTSIHTYDVDDPVSLYN